MDAVKASVTTYLDKLAGQRKYTMALAIILLATVLVGFDKLSGRQWVDICGATMLFFGAANVGEHYTKQQNKREAE